ncbi:MAG: TolC family protein [Ignavibacteriaceae bacterium]
MINQKIPTGFIISILLIFYFIQPVTISQISVSNESINIAVVRDGPTGDVEITALIEPELKHLLGDDYTLNFIESTEFNAQWDPNNFRSVIENALNDETVDIILGVGAMVTQEAANDDLVLAKPFVSTTILTGDVPPLPYSTDDHSLKENLVFLILPTSRDKDFEALKKLIQIDTLHFGIPIEELNYLRNMLPKINTFSKEIGVTIIPVPISKDIKKTITEIPTRAQAFYYLRTPRLTISERKELTDSLISRKIPVFSGMGVEDIELGVFATNKPNMNLEVARRSAINLFRLIRGEQSANLPVFMVSDFKLIINGKTAAKIGYYPDYDIRITATILYREYLEGDVKEINLKEALNLAAKGNTSLSITSSEVQTSLQESRVARGFMFPQLNLTADYKHIGWNSFNALVPENFAQFGVGISQMVFDDEVISNFSSAGSQYEAAEFRYKSDKLDIYLQAAQAYLNYVQARLFHQIELDNLRLTESNLEIAQMRVDVGQAGRDEVYRWTTELENRKGAVLNAEAIIEATRITLNQVLGLNQNNNWSPEEIELKPGEFYFLKGNFDDIFENQTNLTAFRESSIKSSLENSPELQFLYKSIEAQEIQIGQVKRSFFVPKIYADFVYGNNFWQNPSVPVLDESGITFGLTARLPIFEGTSKIYRIQREESVRNELTNTVLLTEELLEQRTRTTIRNLESSFPNISLSKNAAENAKLNLDVVQEKYANGIASITDLLEAQNANFISDQNSISAIYNFLGDLVQYQRSISFFEDTKTQEEKDEFLLKFYEEKNQ